jgi:hypothetical protein
MLKNLRQWLFGTPVPAGWASVRAWSGEQGGRFRPTHERDGFAVELDLASAPARLEWGPSQRRYLGPSELRLRADTGLEPQLYALVMPRSLLQSLERDIFNQFTDSVKTRLDEETPEEMRWLAMSPKLNAQQLGALGQDYAAVSNVGAWVADWLGGPLGQALLACAEPGLAGPNWPLALIVQRGRLVLRAAMPAPDSQAIGRYFELFSLALTAARRLPRVI